MGAAIACHNVRVAYGKTDNGKRFGGCFGFCKPRKTKDLHYEMGIGLCATSLGPHDATFVAGNKPWESGSGYTVLTGRLAAMSKEFVRWSKVDQAGNGCLGNLIWKIVH